MPTDVAPVSAEPEELDDGKDMEPMLDLSEPTADDLEYARRELGETEDARTRTLQELKDMIYERGEVTPYRMDDPFLLRFLRARSFDVERAHRLLTRYTRFKENNPTYQKDVDPEAFKVLADDDVMTVLPYLDQHKRRILVYRMGNWDPSKISVDDIFKATLIVLELGIMEPRAQIRGGIVIFDLEGMGLNHAWQTTPAIAAKTLQLLETSSPMKTMAVHVLNESWVFDIIYGLFSPLLGERGTEKLFFHGSDLSSLHEHVDPKHLPKRYGGTRGEVNYAAWIKALRSRNIFRKELKMLGYRIEEDESLEEY